MNTIIRSTDQIQCSNDQARHGGGDSGTNHIPPNPFPPIHFAIIPTYYNDPFPIYSQC